jgi:hypothetical protein
VPIQVHCLVLSSLGGLGGQGRVPSQKGLHARGSTQSKRTACKGEVPSQKGQHGNVTK